MYILEIQESKVKNRELIVILTAVVSVRQLGIPHEIPCQIDTFGVHTKCIWTRVKFISLSTSYALLNEDGGLSFYLNSVAYLSRHQNQQAMFVCSTQL